MPRRRQSSAISHPRFTWPVSIMEMPTTSGEPPEGMGSTFSSMNSTSHSGGRAAAKTTGPWGGRWNSVCRSSFFQRG